jgi:hypothetical protein
LGFRRVTLIGAYAFSRCRINFRGAARAQNNAKDSARACENSVKRELTQSAQFSRAVQVNATLGGGGKRAGNTNAINSPRVLSSSWLADRYATTKLVTPETHGGSTGKAQ